MSDDTMKTRYAIPLEETDINHLVGDPVDGEYVGYTWRYVRAPNYDPNRDPKYNRRIAKKVVSGKWLIFLTKDEESFMAVWPIIKEATAMGQLGIASKIRNPQTSVENSLVVCVYTKDYRDENDVMRIREVLRGMGFDKRLSYKPDYKTLKGNYGSDTIKYRA